LLYATALAFAREPLPGVRERVELPSLAPSRTPQRLRAAPEVVGGAPPATDEARVTPAVLTVRLAQLHPFLRGHDAGIAVFHAVTGSRFQWLPLRDAERDASGGFVVRTSAAPGTRMAVTLAVERRHARHGYLERREIEITGDAAAALVEVPLSGRIHAVRFDLPVGADHAGPLRLARADDPQWLPMLHGTSGLTLAIGTERMLRLGAGTYELRDPLDVERNQRFDVTADTVIVLLPELTRARGDRP
jgi:hypothetical protein